MPLAEAAYAQLHNLILAGHLPPDSAITENSIVERIKIGKTPVREAMRRLVLEGLLDVTPRLGYTVIGITRQDVDDIFQMRVIVEVAAAQLAVEHMSDDALDRLQELSITGYDPTDSASLERYAVQNTEFHDIIAKRSGNQRLADQISRLMLESRRFVQIAQLTPEHGQLVVSQHQAIVDALGARDRDAVSEAVRVHVEDSWHLVLDSLTEAAGTAADRGAV